MQGGAARTSRGEGDAEGAWPAGVRQGDGRGTPRLAERAGLAAYSTGDAGARRDVAGDGQAAGAAGAAGARRATAGRILWSQSEAAQLNDVIASQTSAAQVLRLFQERATDWGRLQLVTALHRVARAPDGCEAPRAALRELLALVAASLGQCGAQQLANSAWALAKLLIRDPPLRDSIASAAIGPMATFKAQELANTAWSMAKLAVAHLPLLAAIASAAIGMSYE